MSGLSQTSGFSFSSTMPDTAMGNSRFAGKAASNCAIGCTMLAARGRSPTHTPIGTQTRLASAISTATRSSVRSPSSMTRPISAGCTSPRTNRVVFHSAASPTSPSSAYQA